MSPPVTVRIFLDPNIAGLAFDVIGDAPFAGSFFSDRYRSEASACGPDRSGIDGYGEHGDQAHVDDVNAAVGALAPYMVGGIDTSHVGSGELLRAQVRAGDVEPAWRALEGLCR